MIKNIVTYTNGRFWEWSMSWLYLWTAVFILIWPTTIVRSNFKYVMLAEYPYMLALAFAAIAATRTAALIINGRSKVYGPRVRAWTALASAVMFAQLGIGLVLLAVIDERAPSVGIPVWITLSIGEFITAYKAATNVRVH